MTIELEARKTEWTIAGGLTVAGFGYNGQVPGPVIEAAVGDTLTVRLTNRLPQPTTIHWHGVRLPALMDGTELMRHAVAPGETFEYRFTLPDAGTFWYHSHVNETEQMERGLYGALIVRGPGEPVVDRERVLVLDDAKVNRRGRIARPGWWLERHNGREGSVLLVNGRAGARFDVSAGQIERWRIVNAASARYVRLSVGDTEFQILGTDGGLLTAPTRAKEVLLTPGDRIDIAVGPFHAGRTIGIDSLPYDRGASTNGHERFAVLNVGAPRPSRAAIPDRLASIDPLVTGKVAATREVRLGGRMSLRHGPEFLVNGQPHHHDAPVRVGELQVWDVVNDTPIDHPFHLHGFFFQVVHVNGVTPDVLSWEDTVNVPAKARVRIAWRPDNRPGTWMYHCHILEHLAAGMGAHFDVIE